ncbi:MAG: hypothetical protein R3B47_19225 [Bacteroidia bacterium]
MQAEANIADMDLLSGILRLAGPGQDWNISPSDPTQGQEAFGYVANPDGSPRWFFPLDSKSVRFLDLYSSASIKARAFRIGVIAASKLGQRNRLISGTFSFSKKHNNLASLCQQLGYRDYAVFTGTAGQDRKSVVALGNKGPTEVFLKIAHSPVAAGLVRTEAEVLAQLGKISFQHLAVPALVESGYPHIIGQANARPSRATQASTSSRFI